MVATQGNIDQVFKIFSSAHASDVNIEMSEKHSPMVDLEKKTIYLPVLSDELDKETLFNHLKHEIAHVKFTKKKKYDNKLLKDIVNAVEDLRIEFLYGKEYPGAAKGFFKTNTMLRDKLVSSLTEEKEEKASSISPVGLCLMKFMFKTMSIPLEIKSEKLKEVVERADILLSKLEENIEGLIEGFYTEIKTFEDVEVLSDRIYELLKEHATKEDFQGDNQPGNEDGDGDGEGKKSKKKIKLSELMKMRPSKIGEEGEEVEIEEEYEGQLSEFIDKLRTEDIEEQSKKKEQDILHDSSGSVYIKEEIYVGKKIKGLLEDNVGRSSGASRYNKKKTIVNNDINKIKRIMSKRLNEKLFRGITPNLKRGKINTHSLYRHEYDDRLFQKKAKVTEVGAAISLLVDLSGSMCAPVESKGIRMNRLEWMVTSIISFLESVKHLKNIKTEVSFFTIDFNPYMRTEGGLEVARLLHYIFKTFNEDNFNDVKKNLDLLLEMVERNIGSIAWDNYDRRSVECAYERLLTQEEKNKVLMVFSDGEPASRMANCSGENTSLNRITKKIENEGKVNLIGVGIQNSSVKSYYKNNMVVENLSEIPKRLEKVLVANV